MRISESNMEHYRNDILKVIKSGNNFSIKNGKITECHETECWECEFYQKGCGKARVIWLMEDYKEPITLTAKEKHLVEFLETGYIARDGNGNLHWYEEEPIKEINEWMFVKAKNVKYAGIMSYGELLDFITWEDEEPWSVEELRKLEVKDE